VTAALAARDALRSTNGDDSHNSGTGVRRTERATHECTYTDSLNNCAVENQVKFATCTLHSVALTWWNTHVKTIGHEAACGMPWKTLLKMMTEKYCPRNEIRKLEIELWDLKIEKYIRGLPDMIHGSVVASKPKTMQEAVDIATELMDKKIHTFAERETASKRKFENTSRNTQNQQQQSNKRSTENTNNANNQRGTRLGQKTACYECGVQGHFKRECPKLKNNNNHCNQGGRNNAPARVYAVSRAGIDPDVNFVTEFETRVRQDTDEIYMRLDDQQTERQLLAGWLNMFFRDRRAHAYTRHLMEIEAMMSREAWVRSTDASDLVRGEVMSLRTTVLGQMTEIRELHAADRRSQTVISEMLRADHKRSIEIIELRKALQGQVTAL
nr:hypothetical protein [Tanacetum cinerariifolium]